MRYNNRMRKYHCTNLHPDIEPEVSPDSTPDSCHSQQLNDTQPPLTDIHPFFQKRPFIFAIQQLNQYIKHETFAFQTLPILLMPHRDNTNDSAKQKIA